jgi:hypothetical protein
MTSLIAAVLVAAITVPQVVMWLRDDASERAWLARQAEPATDTADDDAA